MVGLVSGGAGQLFLPASCLFQARPSLGEGALLSLPPGLGGRELVAAPLVRFCLGCLQLPSHSTLRQPGGSMAQLFFLLFDEPLPLGGLRRGLRVVGRPFVQGGEGGVAESTPLALGLASALEGSLHLEPR